MRTLIALLLAALSIRAADVLVVADEFPAMENLARELKQRIAVTSEIITQDRMPPVLSSYRAVVVYIHRDIAPSAEQAFIDYATGGGRLVLLHHSISSGKRKNKEWFRFLGVDLPTSLFEQGGYKYFDPADFALVNAAPSHPVMKGAPQEVQMHGSEVYINHVLTGDRTTLLSIRYTEPKSGRTFEQPSGGWYRPTGKGDVFYFMAGHKPDDFNQPAYAQIIANAVAYRR